MLSTFLSLTLLATGVLSQSPGPDFPKCSTVSKGSEPWGWEVSRINYKPIMPRRSDANNAQLEIEIENHADGSRTQCVLSVVPRSGQSTASIILDSRMGGCTAAVGQAAFVWFETQSGVLNIRQDWSCRENDGSISKFTGTGIAQVLWQCAAGKEGERNSCVSTNLKDSSLILEPPSFIWGSASEQISLGPATPPWTPAAIGEQCVAPKPTWQVLSLSYVPPAANVPKSASYWPTSLTVDLRNLNDGSRIKCYLGEEDVSNFQGPNGITLRNNGTKLGTAKGFPNRAFGCQAGWWYGGDVKQQKAPTEWKWHRVPDVSFNTKTQVLSVSQTWPCTTVTTDEETGDQTVNNVTVLGSTEQKLDFDCKSTSNRYNPQSCAVKGLVATGEGKGAVILGPGVARRVSG
ncbi:hypothetical protein QBC35DRAFT_456285 [Podospora australis]|uniref:AA1-like domain-containing protein n=1 Tax=Podospora australis TaxID=1536484 RepID=A0AAN7ADR1_9PEZI|nr:hypothetical protein QBC35DRAFT_456285 [Podospora australis]